MDRFNTFKLFIETNRNKLIIVLITIVIVFVSTIMFLNIDRKVNMKTESKTFSNLNLKEDTISNQDEKVDDVKEYYFVDIKGEVISPGVYSLEKGKRVVDAINKAGGLTEKADTTFINQSIKLSDQMVIVIYSKDDTSNLDSFKEELVQKDELYNQDLKNDAYIYNTETVIIPDIENKNTTSNTNDGISQNNKININSASCDMLMTLPKIGSVKANAIINYRDANGKFNSIEEIKQVKGIGESLFDSIKDYITI
ncbi:MAG: helix-hairpin-helix domain-containing protein [Bacilli bacterium]|nr:helix-hairpin-helix domain-containing protein [Bacilli bacterium]